MKKRLRLSWALAALTAVSLSAPAEIVTSNIVGFQEFNGVSTFTLTAPTFIPVGSEDGGATMTLGAIRANSDFVAGADSITLFENGNVLMDLTFYPYDDPDGYGIPGGWYEIDDFNTSDEPLLLNDEPLPFGIAFAFTRANESACLVYAGEVKATDTILPSVSTFTLNGNVVPEDGTLAVFRGNDDFVAGADSVTLFENGNVLMDITFYPYDDPDGYGISGGWYELDDFNTSDEPLLLNDEVLLSSIGFAFTRANDDARVIVSAPILN